MNFCERCDPSDRPVWKPGEGPAPGQAPDPLDCRRDAVLCPAGDRAAAAFLDAVAQRRAAAGTVFRDEDFPR